MKNIIQEKNKLPLTFSYLEIIKRKKTIRKSVQIAYYTKSKKYQTDFLLIEEPEKSLVRLL
ncbi:hypothetical protein AOB46_15625 [Chryseobacterium indologenes]|uniref:Uncharacterized protein n=1 Tax=Chryseobacterium indologenes TaxID=253 RepID=A0A0N0ZTH3_CHRID|nr:hypothetical protein AOB46_15625 [Chryseobacterium indologenes]